MEKDLNRAGCSNAEQKHGATNVISHNLRTPITCILGFSHLLNSTKLTEEQKGCLQSINQSTYQLLATANHLIDDLRLNKG